MWSTIAGLTVGAAFGYTGGVAYGLYNMRVFQLNFHDSHSSSMAKRAAIRRTIMIPSEDGDGCEAALQQLRTHASSLMKTQKPSYNEQYYEIREWSNGVGWKLGAEATKHRA